MPSYPAHAMWDSWMTTFRLPTPAAAGPSLPALIRSTMRSNRIRARNSVVVLARELRDVVEVAVVIDRDDFLERGACETDVHDEAVRIEFRPAELDVDDERGAMQPLCGAKHVAAETVGNHQMIADAD